MRIASMISVLVLIGPSAQLLAQGPDTGQYPAGVILSDADQSIRIREVAAVKLQPDTLYLLMKIQSEGAQLQQAIDQNRKAVDGFIAALKQLPIEPSDIRLSNLVVTSTMMRTGASFARNVLITIPNIDRKPEGEINKLIAAVQDLGARYGSHCITCIGSG